MGEDKDFQKRVQRIGELVHELDSIVDPAASSACKALVQSLMALHGQGLERMLDVVFKSANSGAPLIDELGQDPLVSSLLILYGLHPDDLQTRVQRKIEQLESRLLKMGAEARLLSVNGGDIRLRASVEGHGCGSTSKTVRAMLEEAMYEAAPDLTSLVIEGLEEPVASGFVGLAKLMGSSAAHPAALRSEGMD